MAMAKRKREGGGAKMEEEEDEILNRRIDKLLSLCERAAQARLHPSEGSESSQESEGEVLAQRIYAILYDAIPRCAAFAYKKSTGAKHPMCFLKEVMTAEEFAGSKDPRNQTQQALGTRAWQAVSAYAVCLDETLREVMVARPQTTKEKDGEGNGGEAEAAGTREEEARAMLGAFREDAERALEGEVGGENGRAELLMMGLMQGYDALSQLEKEAVLDAERRSR